VRGIEAEGIEKAGGIVRHVLHRALRSGRAGQQVGEAGLADVVEPRRPADITVVISDDMESGVGQGTAEGRVPQCELTAESHDQ